MIPTQKYKTEIITAAATLKKGTELAFITLGDGGFTVTLPTPRKGRILHVVTSTSGSSITLAGNVSGDEEWTDGIGSWVCYSFASDGNTWYIIGYWND